MPKYHKISLVLFKLSLNCIQLLVTLFHCSLIVSFSYLRTVIIQNSYKSKSPRDNSSNSISPSPPPSYTSSLTSYNHCMALLLYPQRTNKGVCTPIPLVA